MQAIAQTPDPLVNTDRFNDLIRAHHRGLTAYATVLAKSESTANDLLQDSYLVAWKSADTFDRSRDFGAWLRGVIRNKWREHCRRHARETMLDESTLERLEAVFQDEPDNDLFDRLNSCRQKLPQAMQDALHHTYTDGCTSDEAASRLQTSPSALRKRLERARAALRDCLSRSTKI